MRNQFLVVEARSKENGASVPVGLALWASVSEEVDKRLSENLDRPIKLRPDEWRSGEINWLVDMIGDEKIKDPLFKKVRSTVSKEKIIKYRNMNNTGQFDIHEF